MSQAPDPAQTNGGLAKPAAPANTLKATLHATAPEFKPQSRARSVKGVVVSKTED